MSDNKCFSPETITSYVRMELDEETTIALMVHILECPICQKAEAIEHARQTSASKCVEEKTRCLTWKQAMTAAFCIGFNVPVMLEECEREHATKCLRCRDLVYGAALFVCSLNDETGIETLMETDSEAMVHEQRLEDMVSMVRHSASAEKGSEMSFMTANKTAHVI